MILYTGVFQMQTSPPISYNQEETIDVTELTQSLDSYIDKLISNDLQKIAIVHNDKMQSVILSIEEYERLAKFSAQIHPSPPLYSNVPILVNEKEKTILINPEEERFYNVACDDWDTIFLNASLSKDRDGIYTIEGTQTIFTEHKETLSTYQELLCRHPQELIQERSFMGLFKWYAVYGTMKRELLVSYKCKHQKYTIIQRVALLSREVKFDNNS